MSEYEESESIFIEEAEEGIDRKDQARMLIANDIYKLMIQINKLLNEGKWGLVGTPFQTDLGYCQMMMRVPKIKTARQSLA